MTWSVRRLWDRICDEVDFVLGEFGIPVIVSLPYAVFTLWLIRLAAPRVPFPWVVSHPWTTAVVFAVVALVSGIVYLTMGLLDASGALVIYLVEIGSLAFHLAAHLGPWQWVAWSLQSLLFLLMNVLSPPPV